MSPQIYSNRSGLLLLLAMSALLALVLACGGDGDGGSGGSGAGAGLTSGGGSGGSSSSGDDPCSLTTPEMVAAAFGGSSSDGEAGIARNCTFALTGGVTDTVNVFHYGSAGSWDGVRQGFVDNRTGMEDIDGIGDGAFGEGAGEIVVRAGDVIFSVVDFNGNAEAVEQLARAIADAQ